MDISLSININSNQILSSGLTPPLDDYTGAQTAYSIARKLRTAYTGDAIRVRESSGDTEADIGFDANGDLDETALLAHTGSNSGYVVTAYDQSGNSNDWTQATANKQPRIVNAGTVEKVNGKPAIYSDATASSQDGLQTVTLTGASPSTSFHVYQATRNNTTVNTSTNGNVFYGISTSGGAGVCYSNAGTPTIYINGASIGTSRGNLYTATNTLQVVNSWISLDLSNVNWVKYNTDYGTSDSFSAPDYIQETIIYNSDKSSDRANIESNINDYYTIY